MSSASFKYASYLSRQRGIPTIFLQNVVTTMFIFITSLLLTGVSSQSDMSPENLSFGSLEECSDSSYTMSRFGPEDVLAPCVLYDIRDFSYSNPDLSLELIDIDLQAIEGTSPNRTSEITLVQVTPSSCHNHRDGAATAVKLLNANHDATHSDFRHDTSEDPDLHTQVSDSHDRYRSPRWVCNAFICIWRVLQPRGGCGRAL